MVSFYRMLSISKQGHYKRVNRQKYLDQQSFILIKAAKRIREIHHKMGCRKLYYEIKPAGIGRDRAESILLSNDFRVKRKRNYHRTTYSSNHWYPNAIENMVITDINQLWVSDLTYIPLSRGQFYYLTLILDVYSRKIVGWSLSVTMQAWRTIIPAYVMALKLKPTTKKSLIFHSDRGSQYYCKELKALHLKHKVQPSMGGKAWKNAHAESLNGILKNEYIDLELCNLTLKETRKFIKKIIYKYNYLRPHGSLNKMKPIEFEQYIKTIELEEKPIFTINY